MRAAIVLTLAAAGVLAGIYVGVWWAFFGGIFQLVQEVRADELSEAGIVCGVLRIAFAGPLCYLTASVFIVPANIIATPRK